MADQVDLGDQVAMKNMESYLLVEYVLGSPFSVRVLPLSIGFAILPIS